MQSQSSFEIRKANTNQLFSQLVKDIESKTGDEQNWKDRLQHVISLYEGCINVAQTNHEKSMIHKNLIKVYRFCCMTYSDPEAKLLYFDEMISNASEAIYRGSDTQKHEWTISIIEQGEAWHALLCQILEEQTCEYRADYYEKVFLRCNKYSVCLLFMLAHRLADAYFKFSVKLSEEKKDKQAN